ncbi:MAG: NINE protein [Acetatifactor sp.]|nr:NINE protein [Acetatifactor sp.]
MKYCYNCGAELGDDFDFCTECGAEQSSSPLVSSQINIKICKKCGAEMPEDMYYCLECGNKFDQDAPENHNDSIRKVQEQDFGVWKNKWVSLILCLFFGCFGMHRFYEGKKFTGFMYLCTFGFCGVGVFFDLILIITKPNPYRVK